MRLLWCKRFRKLPIDGALKQPAKRRTQMHELLDEIRWNKYEKVGATIVSGGGFFPLKGVIQDSDPRRMAVSFD
jgi:hypothetical protein